MDTSKVYFDSEGNECSIWRMVKREPTWAAVRIQEGEKAIDEITTLRQQLADAKEENEQVRQANLDVMMHFEDMKAAKELAEWRLNAFTVAALLICREEAVEWDSDRLQTYKNYAEVCGRRIGELSKNAVDAFMLRAQADALTAACNAIDGFELPTDNEQQEEGVVRAQEWFESYAQRLRQQADEAERAGGEK